MAKNRLGWKTYRSSRKMKLLQREEERREKKVERMRAKTKRLGKSMTKAEAKLRSIQKHLEEVRKANWQVYKDNAFADTFVEINLAIFEAEDAGDFLTAEQLAQTLCDLMAHWGEEKQDPDDDSDDDQD